MGEEHCCIQLVDQNGNFNYHGIEDFEKKLKLGQLGCSYVVASIIGPQSSGKSTLLNHLFGTNFKEMDAFQGRSQTTKGIWLAKSVDMNPTTLVMDFEGTDAMERGEDDIAFENQSALFALAVSNVVLINIWCHDIGRERAANRPLLKTVFKVMMKLFGIQKKTLIFVIRDKTKTPLELLESKLRNDIKEIWDATPKPQTHKGTQLNEIFNIEVVALGNYEEKKDEFKDQVSNLRQQFINYIVPNGHVGDQWNAIATSGFSLYAQLIWKSIKEDKELNLPSHKVMVATILCEEIANEMLDSLSGSKEWCQLKEDAESRLVSDFGWRLSSILKKFLSEYDSETCYFDEGIRTRKRKEFEEKMMELVRPSYKSTLGHLRSRTLSDFKCAFHFDKTRTIGSGFDGIARNLQDSRMEQFDRWCADHATVEQVDWDNSKVRCDLKRDINAHIDSIRADQVAYEEMKQLKKNLIIGKTVGAILSIGVLTVSLAMGS